MTVERKARKHRTEVMLAAALLVLSVIGLIAIAWWLRQPSLQDDQDDQIVYRLVEMIDPGRPLRFSFPRSGREFTVQPSTEQHRIALAMFNCVYQTRDLSSDQKVIRASAPCVVSQDGSELFRLYAGGFLAEIPTERGPSRVCSLLRSATPMPVRRGLHELVTEQTIRASDS